MGNERDSTAGLVGLLGLGVAVCCGLPVLLGAAVTVGVVGLAIGSAVLVAAGASLGLWGWCRRRRRGVRS